MKLRFVSRQAYERNPTDGRGGELKRKRAILNSAGKMKGRNNYRPNPLISCLGVTAVSGWKGAEYALQAIYRTAVPPGPAARWLIERFAAQVDKPAPTGRRRKFR
jgi:hypothetical protein